MIDAWELEGLEAEQMHITAQEVRRQIYESDGGAAAQEFQDAYDATATLSYAVGADILLTRGQLTKHMFKQMGVQTGFTVIDQAISGEQIDAKSAMQQAIGQADLFDASFDTAMQKFVPGGSIFAEMGKKLIPATIDLTKDGGLQTFGSDKDFAEVALDFSFSVTVDYLKEGSIPNMKFSGNKWAQKIKNAFIDYSADAAQSSDGDSSSQSSNSNSIEVRSERYDAVKEQDNTKVAKYE